MAQQTTIQLSKNKLGGRPKCLTKTQLLYAIHHYATASPTELLKKLEKDGVEASIRTLYRRLKEINPEIINAILSEVQYDELIPEHQSYSAFKQLKIVKTYSDNLLHTREVSKRYHNRRISDLFWICKTLNKNPKALTSKESIELCAKLILNIKKGNLRRNLEGTMTSIRSWYAFNAVATEYLTSKGITGERQNRGKRSKIRFTKEERCRIMEVIKSKFHENVAVIRQSNSKYVGLICFRSEPDLQRAMICCVKFLFYTGTRIEATLQAKWKDVTWGNPITSVHVLDKGRHKHGREEWNKRISGEFLEEFKDYWRSMGQPQDESYIFPFRKDVVRNFLKQCYVEAEIPKHKWQGMPCHIWRHTACQELLDANGRNFDSTAEILGWLSVDTMKEFYGKQDKNGLDTSLMKAMGLPIPEQEKKEFKF